MADDPQPNGHALAAFDHAVLEAVLLQSWLLCSLEDSPSICLPSLHFPSRTHKLQRTETGKKWWVRRTREIRECVHTTTHLFQLLLCACVCVRV